MICLRFLRSRFLSDFWCLYPYRRFSGKILALAAVHFFGSWSTKFMCQWCLSFTQLGPSLLPQSSSVRQKEFHSNQIKRPIWSRREECILEFKIFWAHPISKGIWKSALSSSDAIKAVFMPNLSRSVRFRVDQVHLTTLRLSPFFSIRSSLSIWTKSAFFLSNQSWQSGRLLSWLYIPRKESKKRSLKGSNDK